jgi:hypothetical protein
LVLKRWQLAIDIGPFWLCHLLPSFTTTSDSF